MGAVPGRRPDQVDHVARVINLGIPVQQAAGERGPPQRGHQAQCVPAAELAMQGKAANLPAGHAQDIVRPTPVPTYARSQPVVRERERDDRPDQVRR